MPKKEKESQEVQDTLLFEKLIETINATNNLCVGLATALVQKGLLTDNEITEGMNEYIKKVNAKINEKQS